MTTHDELPALFDTHPDTNRVVAFGENAALVRGKDAAAVAVMVTLLSPADKTSTDKSLVLQVQPQDAVAVAAAILAHAVENDWPMPASLLSLVETLPFDPDAPKH